MGKNKKKNKNKQSTVKTEEQSEDALPCTSGKEIQNVNAAENGIGKSVAPEGKEKASISNIGCENNVQVTIDAGSEALKNGYTESVKMGQMQNDIQTSKDKEHRCLEKDITFEGDSQVINDDHTHFLEVADIEHGIQTSRYEHSQEENEIYLAEVEKLKSKISVFDTKIAEMEMSFNKLSSAHEQLAERVHAIEGGERQTKGKTEDYAQHGYEVASPPIAEMEMSLNKLSLDHGQLEERVLALESHQWKTKEDNIDYAKHEDEFASGPVIELAPGITQITQQNTPVDVDVKPLEMALQNASVSPTPVLMEPSEATMPSNGTAMDDKISDNIFDKEPHIQTIYHAMEEIRCEESMTNGSMTCDLADSAEVSDNALPPASNLGEKGASQDADISTVPLSEAPLVGAPFRLISFVTKYVSGADLVKPKNSSVHH